jgi:hypothetical protein
VAALSESAMAGDMREDDFQSLPDRDLRAMEMGRRARAPSAQQSQGRLARKVIAALRKGGIACCLVISDTDYTEGK